VASALATTSATNTSSGGSGGGGDGWIGDRLRNLIKAIDLNNGKIADFLQHLHDENTAFDRALLVKIDQVADKYGLDDHFLDSLLVDLGLE
jgi:hypothetical protein